MDIMIRQDDLQGKDDGGETRLWKISASRPTSKLLTNIRMIYFINEILCSWVAELVKVGIGNGSTR